MDIIISVMNGLCEYDGRTLELSKTAPDTKNNHHGIER